MLTRIDLLLNTEEYDSNYESTFAFRNRFIGVYLRRRLQPLKYATTGYTRIVILGCRKQCRESYIIDKILFVSILFPQAQYDKLPIDQQAEFFSELYTAGIHKANQTHPLPVTFLLTQLANLKADHYKNEWMFKSRTIKALGLKATLNCRINSDAFTLTLLLSSKKEVVFESVILETLPDEIIYHYRFKDIVYHDHELQVVDKFGKSIFTLDLTFSA